MGELRRIWCARTRRAFAFVALPAVAVVVAGCGGDESPAASSGKTFNWDMMVISGPNGTGGVGDKQQELADEIAKQTDGRLTITLRAPGELPYTMDKLLSSVGSGRVEIGDAGVLSAGESKALAIFGLPFLINTPEDYVTAVKALEPTLKADFDRYGVTQVGYYNWPQQTVWGQGDPPATLQDIKGRRIRASSPEQAFLFEQLDARPTTLISAEVGQALQRSVIDSVSSSAFNIVPLKWGEDLDWGYMTPLGYVPGIIVINNDALASLPEDIRATVEQVSQDWQKEMLEYMPGAEERDRKVLSDQGLKLVDGDPGDEALGAEIMSPYWDKWGQENNETEAIDAVKKALGH